MIFLEFPTTPVNELLKEFKKLKAEELNNILRDRGQPVTGKKADLVLDITYSSVKRQKS